MMSSAFKTDTNISGRADNLVGYFYTVIFAVFVFFAIRYQILLLDYLAFGDEAETVVAAKMMAAGQKLYSEIFNHHGPLTFLPGMVLEFFGSFGIAEHRIFLAFLQVIAVGAIYFSPLLESSIARKIYAVVAATVGLLFFPDMFGSMYMYQNMAGLFLVVILAQYTLPAILTPTKLTGNKVFWGSFLIACIPFLAITYVPVAILFFLSSLRRAFLVRIFLGVLVGIVANILFLIFFGSVAGFLAFHIYMNSQILPLYNGGQDGLLLIFNSFKFATGSLVGFTIFSIIFTAISRLGSAEKGLPWRSIFVGLGVASLLIRGGGFHGLPYYYSFLAIPLVFFLGRPVLSRQIQFLAALFILVCILKVSLVIPADKNNIESKKNPKSTEFSQLVRSFTNKEDRIIVYSFNNVEYILADRLPASGNFFYLPWQEKYNEKPKYGIKIDSCADISNYRPKLIFSNKWKVWGSFTWESYATCVQSILDKEYVQLPGKPYYFRKDIFSEVVSSSVGAFVGSYKGAIGAVNDLSVIDGAGTFKVTGRDPFFVYYFAKPVPAEYAKKIAFELTCTGASNNKKLPVQIFWETQAGGFNEAKSIVLPVASGATSVMIYKFPSWSSSEDITGIRFDLFSPGDCMQVMIKNVQLGY